MVETNFLGFFLSKLIKTNENFENFEKLVEACPKTIFAEGLREGAAKFRKIMFLAAISPDFHAWKKLMFALIKLNLGKLWVKL